MKKYKAFFNFVTESGCEIAPKTIFVGYLWSNKKT